MIARRVLAIFAAMLLVGAFALAIFEPPGLSLGSFLHHVNGGFVSLVHASLERHGAAWVWNGILWPILMRPAWLLPAAGGILCAGGAMSLALAGDARPTRRWRG